MGDDGVVRNSETVVDPSVADLTEVEESLERIED